MKKLILTAIAATGLMLLCSANEASAQKFGYIDSNMLVEAMPEMADVRTKFEAFVKDLDDAYELMRVEYNNKMDEFTKNANTYSDAIRKVKEDEIQKLQERIMQFEQSAQQSMRDEEGKLMTPIMEKARDAIQKVSAANGFLMVFDVSRGSLVYFDEKTMINVLPLVKTELGIK